ncbi:hypothetical protein LEP1GSC193_1228 [Leptospira alstonii serovar Pingchang str. 80-412]|uniref:Alpha/beta hydrolase domain protein n=1 Tax=Leptospira alstonii serovar Pingchang str. 80-412 TaxID=1218564 RepID=T0G8R0_9LEPT|nr:hypothetical protein LEP1GSC193_1228 [Leptospira alstonii serovar Pingchang str. 80-412]
MEEWKQSGFYVSYQNRKIFLKEEGNGENLLLIHGFPTASFDWSLRTEERKSLIS